MAETHQLFASPFVVDKLQSDEGVVALRKVIEDERARDSQGIKISNMGGWHSNTDMAEWGGEVARALAFKAMTMADALTVDSKSPKQSRYSWVPEMWANVSGKGDSNQYHTHPGSFWSAVAYIDDGYKGSNDTNLGGELQLQDPRMPMVRMTAPDLRFKEPSGNPQQNEVMIRPRTGMIVLFPSWMQHAVRAFHGEGTRISVAINLIPAVDASAGETRH